MPAPAPGSTATSRPDLMGSMDEFDMELDRAGFIGHRVFPHFTVGLQNNTFGIIPIEEMLKNPETKRGSKSNYNEVDFKFEDSSYSTIDRGLRQLVTPQDAAMYRNYFNAEDKARRFLVHQMALALEKEVADAVFNTTIWTGASLTTSVGTAWGSANATPLVDIENAVQKVYDNSGQWPNALVLSKKLFRALRRDATIVDLVKYNGSQDPRAGNLSAQAIAQALDLEFVFVAGGTKNTAKQGQDASLSQVWNADYAMVCCVGSGSETDDIEYPCIGRTFVWDEFSGDETDAKLIVESYDDPHKLGTWIRTRHHVQVKRIRHLCGHLLTGASS